MHDTPIYGRVLMKMLFQKQESSITCNVHTFQSGHRGVMLSNQFLCLQPKSESYISLGWEKQHNIVTFKTLKIYSMLNIICQKILRILGPLSYKYVTTRVSKKFSKHLLGILFPLNKTTDKVDKCWQLWKLEMGTQAFVIQF